MSHPFVLAPLHPYAPTPLARHPTSPSFAQAPSKIAKKPRKPSCTQETPKILTMPSQSPHDTIPYTPEKQSCAEGDATKENEKPVEELVRR